jgi:two-component system, LytTR family, response regulator
MKTARTAPPPPNRFTALIVDDEDLARAIVREHLLLHGDFELLGECTNGFDAVKAVSELKPDLIFLDIQMPKLNGFEVLEILDPVPAVIFVTAYDTFALKAFEVHAVDYLLKPFTRERFDEALERARQRLSASTPFDAKPLVASTRRESGPAERIIVRNGTRVIVIPVDAIDYVEAQDDYAAIHSGGKSHLKQETLSSIEESLDPARFVRIHRSYLLNIDRLVRVEAYARDSRVAILRDGTKLLVSRAGYDRLEKLL